MRLNTERVNSKLHQIAESMIHEAMAREGAQTGELGGGDAQAKVAFAASIVLRTNMPSVRCALVSELHGARVQRIVQPLLHEQFCGAGHAGLKSIDAELMQ